MSIAKRLKELRTLDDITQNKLAEILGVTQDSISLWEKGKRIPDTSYIIDIVKYFNVSADYLLGLTDDYDTPANSRANAPAVLPLDESELLDNYRALSYAGKARVAAYADLIREQEEGAPTANARKAK